MKTEKELRTVLELSKRALRVNPDCPGCADCFGHQLIIRLIEWQLHGDLEVDRAMEKLAKRCADAGV